MKITKKNALAAGFSLVEMLVVIAVIGIIAAIAIPNIGKVNDAAKDATKRRNAQSIASIFASAQAAGHSFGATGDTEAEVITAVLGGHTIADATSPFDGSRFGVDGMSAASGTGAADYLSWDDGTLILSYTGGN